MNWTYSTRLDMKIAIILPRNMSFDAQTATSIDLCARDFILSSRYRQSTAVICRQSDTLFEGIPVHGFKGGSGYQCLKQITSILDDLSPDLIVVHQHLPSAVTIARRHPTVPVILHKHNFIKRTAEWRQYFQYRRYRKIAGIVFVSEACRTAFARDYPHARPALHVVHNGLPLADWPDNPRKSEDPKEIVAVGMVDPHKGSLEIATALARVMPDYPDWRATFIGAVSSQDGFGDRVRAAIAGCGQICLAGYTPYSKAVSATRKARIAVVNSRGESFGRVAIEAFAARAALICTPAGGLREVIGDTAAISQTGSPDEIEASLRMLMEDPQCGERLAAAGRARFERYFTIDATASKLDDVYEAMHKRSE